MSPYLLVGPAKPNLEIAFFACAGAALALTASSGILGLYAAYKRTSNAARPSDPAAAGPLTELT